MSTIKIDDILTLSVQVTEEIESRNLHTFLKTSILNHDANISKDTYYYFFYNEYNKTYEIVYFENNHNSNLELFGIVEKFNYDDNVIRVLICKKYFIITKNGKLFILKKITDVKREEIQLYIEQMYKIEDVQFIELTQKNLEISEVSRTSLNYDNIHAYYSKKSFYIFCSFLVISIICFVLMSYFRFNENVQMSNTINKKEVTFKSNHFDISKKVTALFKSIENENIIIEQISYNNRQIRTILYHQYKSSLLAFSKKNHGKIDIKSLKYNDKKQMHQMEVLLEY